MLKFRFKKNRVLVNVAGQRFWVEPLKVEALVPEMQERLQGVLEQVQAQPFEASMVENACECLCACVDTMLGKGAASRIFKGKTVSFFDCCDVYFFVIKCARDFVCEKLAAYESLAERGVSDA